MEVSKGDARGICNGWLMDVRLVSCEYLHGDTVRIISRNNPADNCLDVRSRRALLSGSYPPRSSREGAISSSMHSLNSRHTYTGAYPLNPVTCILSQPYFPFPLTGGWLQTQVNNGARRGDAHNSPCLEVQKLRALLYYHLFSSCKAAHDHCAWLDVMLCGTEVSECGQSCMTTARTMVQIDLPK